MPLDTGLISYPDCSLEMTHNLAASCLAPEEPCSVSGDTKTTPFHNICRGGVMDNSEAFLVNLRDPQVDRRMLKSDFVDLTRELRPTLPRRATVGFQEGSRGHAARLPPAARPHKGKDRARRGLRQAQRVGGAAARVVRRLAEAPDAVGGRGRRPTHPRHHERATVRSLRAARLGPRRVSFPGSLSLGIAARDPSAARPGGPYVESEGPRGSVLVSPDNTEPITCNVCLEGNQSSDFSPALSIGNP